MKRPDPRLAAVRRRIAEDDRRIALAAEQLGLRLGRLTTEELGLVLRRALELKDAGR